MMLWTLPDTPVGAPKGIAHLLVVAVFGGLAVVGILLLALFGQAIPDIMNYIAFGVLTYLIGVNAAARNNPKGPPD